MDGDGCVVFVIGSFFGIPIICLLIYLCLFGIEGCKEEMRKANEYERLYYKNRMNQRY